MPHRNQTPTPAALEMEVLWLHSLWRLGPTPNPRDNPLAVASPPVFKKTGKKERNKLKSIEWPCADPPPRPAAEDAGGWCSWGSAPPPPAAARKIPTCEEQARFRALQVQQKGICASKEFFASMNSSDIEDNEDNEDDEDGIDVTRIVDFFVDVFERDSDLRDYYKRNYERGEFCCLVCMGMEEKMGKEFGDCMSLVHHANTISRTKGLEAHRVFAKVICQVIGWDAERLPTIIFRFNGGPNDSSTHDLDLKQQAQPNCLTLLPCNTPLLGAADMHESQDNVAQLPVDANTSFLEAANVCGSGDNVAQLPVDAPSPLLDAVSVRETQENVAQVTVDAQFVLHDGEHMEIADLQQLQQAPDCSVDMPCDLPPPNNPPLDTANGWNSQEKDVAPTLVVETTLIDDKITKIRARQVQQRSINSSKEFFAIMDSSDEEDDPTCDEDIESKSFAFFSDLFKNDAELSAYYKEHFEMGEFYCLACAGVHEKIGKTYGNCTSLFQHANTISKTEGREAHRQFAKVICRVLSWDLERLQL